MERYSEYKDSGVKWLGGIPSNWELRKMKYTFDERSQKGFPNEPLLAATQNHGVILKSQYENRTVEAVKSLDTLKLVEIGDFVISLRSFQGGLEYAHNRGIISPAYTILTPTHIKASFFKHLSKSDIFISLLKSSVTGIREGQNIDYNKLKESLLPIPPEEEQNAMGLYLDAATSKIDKAIVMQQKMIDLLNERKQIIIQNAVTKGLDENVEMKDSGVEWIGMIPKHWGLYPLRKYLNVNSKRNMPNAQLLSVTREEGVIVRNTESKEENHNFIPDDLSNYKYVRKGQFVINKMKSWQGSYGVSNFNGIVSPAYFVYDLNYPNTTYFSMAIRSKMFSPFFSKYSKGIRIDQWDLVPEALKIIPFLEPPVEEQIEIVEYLGNLIPKIESKISNCQRQITLLQERKQIIINEVVTGKVKVS